MARNGLRGFMARRMILSAPRPVGTDSQLHNLAAEGSVEHHGQIEKKILQQAPRVCEVDG
jgi:hypothetical protein